MAGKYPFEVRMEFKPEEGSYSYRGYIHQYPDGLERLQLIQKKLNELGETEIDLNSCKIDIDSRSLEGIDAKFKLEEVENTPAMTKFFKERFYRRVDVSYEITKHFSTTSIAVKKSEGRTPNITMGFDFQKTDFIDFWISVGCPSTVTDSYIKHKTLKLELTDPFNPEEEDDTVHLKDLFIKFKNWIKAVMDE